MIAIRTTACDRVKGPALLPKQRSKSVKQARELICELAGVLIEMDAAPRRVKKALVAALAGHYAAANFTGGPGCKGDLDIIGFPATLDHADVALALAQWLARNVGCEVPTHDSIEKEEEA